MIARAFGISCKGDYHNKNKMPNQDYFRVVNKEKYTLAVCCDGLGSKKHSRVASRRLSKLVTIEINKKFKLGEFNPVELITKIQNKFKRIIFPFKLKNCDTTLQFVIVTSKSIFVFKCGDGIVFINGDNPVLIEEQDDNFINETVSFGKSTREKWIIKNLSKEKYTEIALCTDGISGDLKDKEKIEFFKEIIKLKGDEIKEILYNWPNKYSGDDKTIVVVK